MENSLEIKKVICIDAVGSSYLTLGKIYDVIRHDAVVIDVITDFGNVGSYLVSRFKYVESTPTKPTPTPPMLEWESETVTDLEGRVDGKEYLYSAEVGKTTQIFYLVKTLQMVDYALVHGEHDYPNCDIRYMITLDIEEGEIKLIKHKKVKDNPNQTHTHYQ